jgi:hypothetical protein
MGARSIALLLAATALIACGGDDQQTAATTVPLAVTTTRPVASELAPSQVAASTVPEPELPPPCAVGDLRFSTPADATTEGSVGAVIRIRNAGDVRCEVDVIDSPAADPLMEPDVWIDPGAEAELLVDQATSACAQPAPVSSVDLVVNGTPVTVPVAIAEACGVMLTAIYAVEPVA